MPSQLPLPTRCTASPGRLTHGMTQSNRDPSSRGPDTHDDFGRAHGRREIRPRAERSARRDLLPARSVGRAEVAAPVPAQAVLDDAPDAVVVEQKSRFAPSNGQSGALT